MYSVCKAWGDWETLLDSCLLVKPVMLEQIILVWKQVSLFPELRYFLESVTLILKSQSHLKCSLGQRENRFFPFSSYCSWQSFYCQRNLTLVITWFKRNRQNFQLPYAAIWMYFCPNISLTGQLSSLSFLQHTFQVCSPPCQAPFYCKCLQKQLKLNLSVLVPWLLTWHLICLVRTQSDNFIYFTHSSQSLVPQCPHLNSVFFHSSSFTYASTNQDTVPLICARQAASPQATVLSSSQARPQRHSCRLQSDVCVRQPQPPWQLRALSVLVC